MPKVSKHIRLAARNKKALDYLILANGPHTEWVATIAFYTALQVVEAVLVKKTGTGSSDHGDRNWRLKTGRGLGNLWKHYRPLASASRIARYLQDDYGADYESFSSYLSSEKAEAILVKHHLAQIIKSAAKILGRDPEELLV